ALRSSASAIARRISRLSKGGEEALTMMLVLTLFGSTTHTAFGACALTSFRSGIDTSVGNVISNCPEINPRIAVERLGMMVNSMPSRGGGPFSQKPGFGWRLSDWW